MSTSQISTYVINILMIALVIYMVARVVILQRRNKDNNKLLQILGLIQEEDEFFQEADNYITTSENNEYITKIQVLRLWGDAIYERYDDFEKHVEELNLTYVTVDSKGKSNLAVNEDTFFYLFIAIPNRLYMNDRLDLVKPIDEKIRTVSDKTDAMILKAMHENAMKLFNKEEDCGTTFFNRVLEGDYSEYTYSKQLIGLYKNCITCYLAKYAQDTQDDETFAGYVEELNGFKETHLGDRMIKEMGVVLPEEEHAEVVDVEEESIEEEIQEDSEVVDAEIVDKEEK